MWHKVLRRNNALYEINEFYAINEINALYEFYAINALIFRGRMLVVERCKID